MQRNCFKCGCEINEIVNINFFDKPEDERTLYVCVNCAEKKGAVVSSATQACWVRPVSQQLQIY